MAHAKLHAQVKIKELSQLKRLVGFMVENGYVPGGERCRESTLASLQENGEHWFSNGANEFKVYTDLPFSITLSNFRSLIGPKMDALFASIAD